MLDRLAKAAEAAAEYHTPLADPENRGKYVWNWPEVVRAVLQKIRVCPDLNLSLHEYNDLTEAERWTRRIDAIIEEKIND